jgi:glycosyltransferase involved in cell wall biosynthesis
MKIGTFIILKNESEYLGYHIMSLLDNVDEMIFADGNSTDGSLEILDYIKRKYDKDDKIKLFLNKDCKNLQEDYVTLFNWTLKQVKSDFVWFIHPDMICSNPEQIKTAIKSNAVRYFVNMDSIAGEKRDLHIVSGRSKKWATIYRNDFGLHYYGNYGTTEEDCYFRDFTGDMHEFYTLIKFLPYRIEESGINLIHYCDCKPYERRYERMLSCLKNINPNKDIKELAKIAESHPRVTLRDGDEFKFSLNGSLPEIFDRYKDEFEPLRKGVI